MQAETIPTCAETDSLDDAGQVSVVIPAYNAATYLTATLKSILDQTAPPGEIIVVDDGSTDETVAIASYFGVRVITIPNGGPSVARNVGTRAAQLQHIAFLDADDLWTPDKLALQLAAHRTFRGPAFSFTDYRVIDEHGLRRRQSELSHHWAFRRTVGKVDGRPEIVISAGGEKPILFDSYIQPSTVLVRRADVLAVGGFDETLRVAEDFEFYLRLFKLVPAIAVMKPLMYYRRHVQQATANGLTMKAGLLDVARRVQVAPDLYPSADAKYILGTEHLRYFGLGIAQARVGQLNEASTSLEKSITARRTLVATLALAGARICRTRVGSLLFSAVRTIWKSRRNFR